jgi:uracil-DNA glycosylase family 4
MRKSCEKQFSEFDRLVADAQSCTVCPRMASKTAVFSESNGARHPRVLFVAEAPGRQGGDRTRVPMCGDATGRAFEDLLDSIGLRREEVFITNAVLCNPHTETGANRPPSMREVRNCNAFLARTITLLDPPVVATIGAKALAALNQIEAHGLTLSESAAGPVAWNRRILIPLYHPSPQVLISRRSLEQQRADWQAITLSLQSG